MLACVCKDAADALLASKWGAAVRVDRSGVVREPAGAFDVTVAPGEGVQAAVDACPPGGRVLLLPGVHEGPLVLSAQEVHVFGRGLAVLRAAEGAVLTILSALATVDGLVVRNEMSIEPNDDDDGIYAVWIRGGGLRLQACDLVSNAGTCVRIEGGANATVVSCR